MMRKVYLHARYELKPGDPEPDFRSLFSVMEARRMGRLLKRAVWTASEALKEAGIDVPDAVIIGTDYGCIENSEAFLKALKGIDDAPMKPTHFMQSTHNTISSLIAIRLGAHGYNATYSHRGRSFESALQDAWTQIALGDIDTALVGWFDEMTPALADSLSKQGIEPKENALAVVLSANPEGAISDSFASLGMTF
jgi:3-oxoacyl-(acyl-carrier-protein) synthase